jgi:NADPH:quinone reductase-like Zn-dependent oxidoreductase
MMAAGISEDEALGYLDRECAHDEVVIGCINSPSSVTLSGESKAIDRLQLILHGGGKFARRLRVDVAYHSPQMQVAAEDFLQAIGEISTASEFRVPMFSSVTTKMVPHPRDLNASYWVENMLSTVRFAEAVKNLLSSPPVSQKEGGKLRSKKHWSAILEVGPANSLKGPLNQIVNEFDRKPLANIMYTSMLQRGKSAVATAMEAVGRLWCIGHSIDLGKVNNTKEDALKPKALAMLPPYPWNHNMSFWHEPKASQLARFGHYPRTDLLGVPSDNQNPFEPRWRNFLRISENPWLKDHIITGTCLYPGAGVIIMVLEAALQLVDPKTIAGVGFEDVFFEQGLVIPAEKDAVETALSIKPHESLQSCYQFTLFSIPLGGEWTKHAHGMFSLVPHSANEVDAAASRIEWELIKSRHHDLSHLPSKSIDSASFYSGLKAVGLDYGPLFTNLSDIEAVHGVQCALGKVTIPDTRSRMPFQFEYPHYIHPATLDAMFHLVFVALSGHPGMAEAAIPIYIDQAFISTSLPCGAGAKYVGFSHATTSSKSIAADLIFSDEGWTEAKVTFRGIQLHNVSSNASKSGEKVARSGRQSASRTAQIQWLEDTDCLRGPSAAAFIEAEAYVPWGNALNVGAETGREVEALLPRMAEACEQLAAWLRRLCHKHSDLNVLLIGVNNKEGILRRFAPYEDDNKGSFRFEKCTVLDNCGGALSRVKETLAAEGIICTYSSLVGSVASYDGPLNSYDLIVADIDLLSLDDEVLSTLRPLLRKDGRLALLGLGPTSQLDPQAWEAKLRNADFNGLLFHIQNKETAFLLAAIDEKGGNSIDITEVYLLQPAVISSAIQDLKFNLLQQFQLVGITARDAFLEQASSLKGRVVISLLETEQPFVLAWTAEELDQFRTVVASAKYLLWISRGGLLNSDLKSLQFAPIIGLLRTIRVEQSSITLPHLDLTQELDAGRAASLIYEVFQSTIMAPPPSRNNEMEYWERNGILFIPRLTKRSDLDYDLALLSNSAKTVIAPLKVDSQNLQLQHDLTDSQCSFRWSADKEAIEGIGDHDVVICPAFVSLDVPELRISSASHGTPFDTLVGRIIELGSKVSDLQLGESVVTFHPPIVKTRLSIHRSRICQLPGSWSAPVASYVSLSLATAWHVLFHLARLNRGDHILIQVNSKPLCHFLVQLAQQLGAIVFLVVDSEEERILWQELKGILASRIFNSQSSILGQPILRATGNIGVKIFITTCCGTALYDLASCLAEDGHLIDLGRKIQVKDLSRKFFTRNITISCVDLSRMTDRTLYDLLGEGLDHVRAGHLHGPPKPTITSIAELNNVFQSARSGNQSDNLVLSFNEGAMVPMLHALPPALALNPNGTYIMSGGLGALGLAIANHLVNHGARHLLFLSRSGAVTSEQKDALRNFRDRGCKVDSVKCDITNANQMKKAASICKENHWRITGIIQCAMVLRVRTPSIFIRLKH